MSHLASSKIYQRGVAGRNGFGCASGYEGDTGIQMGKGRQNEVEAEKTGSQSRGKAGSAPRKPLPVFEPPAPGAEAHQTEPSARAGGERVYLLELATGDSRPLASNRMVFTSSARPSTETGFPLKKKPNPATFPALTTISW